MDRSPATVRRMPGGETLAIAAFGVVFLVPGVVLAHLMPHCTVTCEATAGRTACRVTDRYLGMIPFRVQDFDPLGRASVQTYQGTPKKGRPWRYERLVLFGTERLEVRGQFGQAEQAVIEAQRTTGAPRSTRFVDYNPTATALGALLTAVGLLILFAAVRPLFS
jgi:hypothetical protein